MEKSQKQADYIGYIRQKINQFLDVMGTLPLRPEELDDDNLIDLDPIGIIAQSFQQVLQHQQQTNLSLKVAQEEIRSIFDSIDAAVLVIDNKYNIEDYNQVAKSLFFSNNPAENIIGKNIGDACGSECSLLQHILNKTPQNADFVLDGKHFMVNTNSIGEAYSGDRKTIFLFTDITDRQRAEASLRLYENVFNSTTEGILITGADTRILESNAAFSDITQYSKKELLGNKPSIFKSNLHSSDFYEQMWVCLNDNGHWKGEIVDRKKDGSLIPLLQTINRIDDDEGNTIHYVSILSDITTLKENENRLEFLAHHDALTELPNRLLLHDRLEHAIARAERSLQLVGLLFIDLDHFKNINDSLGHDIGDKLLRSVSTRLKTLVRKSDTISRLGGDEFVILLEGIPNKDPCIDLAEKITNTLKPPFMVDHHQLHVNCSIGISFFPEDGADVITLLKNADAAMYHAKDVGRDGFIIYNDELTKATTEKLTIETELRHALEDCELYLHYQPIIDQKQHRVIGAESLLRWNSGTLGEVTPNRFIPIAENTKLIISIGYWVFDQSVFQLNQWLKEGINIDYISINVSSVQLYHADFTATLIKITDKYGVSPYMIQIEITENVMMKDIDHCISVLNELREAGFRLAIDDFGTDYSFLSYLRNLPADTLKIDKSFISQVPDNINDCMITSAIISMARTMELEIIAEGVEEHTQINFLEETGCHQYQGFFFSRPVDASSFTSFYCEYHDDKDYAQILNTRA